MFEGCAGVSRGNAAHDCAATWEHDVDVFRAAGHPRRCPERGRAAVEQRHVAVNHELDAVVAWGQRRPGEDSEVKAAFLNSPLVQELRSHYSLTQQHIGSSTDL